MWNRGDLGGWNVEAGAEGVLNRLVSRTTLFRWRWAECARGSTCRWTTPR
ncbi:hypothetical protein AB5I41_26480 [Sphingomonas sp. MMS24-JH45]